MALHKHSPKEISQLSTPKEHQKRDVQSSKSKSPQPKKKRRRQKRKFKGDELHKNF